MIAGFIEPDSGSISIRGEDVSRRAPYRRDTSMVFQNYALFPHLTVLENVAFGLRYKNVPRRDRHPRAREALAQVRLEGQETKYPAELSGGQQQRVALARAIVTRPALLLLDEPLSNLDLRLRQEMRTELLRIQRLIEVTTIYVTHDQEEAFSMSDSIAVMNSGRILQLATPEEIYHAPRSEFVVRFIGETNSFDCRVVGNDGRQLELETGRGLRVRAATGADNPPIGAGVRLHFREEQARLGATPDDVNSWPCTIEAKQYLGATLSYTTRLATGDVVKVTTPNIKRNLFATGERLHLTIDAEDCVVVYASDATLGETS
jgi:ABC-type Fe3+/spermidine/putrescine transport system ATPase subunit